MATLVGLAGCGPSPAFIPPSGAPNTWTSYGHGVDNDFNNARDTAITPINVHGLTLRWQATTAAMVTSNPIISGNTLYFGTWNGTVEAVNRFTGHVRWTASVAHGPDHPVVHGAPLLYRGTLYVAATDGYIYAFDPRTGALRWRSPQPVFPVGTPDWIESGIVPWNGTLYLGIGGQNDVDGEWGGVAAVAAATGAIRWVTNLDALLAKGMYDAAVFGTPALLPAHGLLFVATGNPVFQGKTLPGPLPYTDAVVALSMRTGRVVWWHQTHRGANDLDFLAGPTLWYAPNGTPMVGAGEKDGFFYAFDALTGRLAWKTDLTPMGTQTMLMNPAAAGYGKLFVGTFDTPLAVLYDGIFPDTYQPPATGRLVALDAQTGRVLWSFAMPSAVPAAPVVGHGMVFADSSNGEVFALNVRNGRPLWWNNAHGEIRHAEAALTLAGDQLFVPVAVPAFWPNYNSGDLSGAVTMFSLHPGR
jgi:polyvinyl alcohol dehydrogenase (cytochrome)